MSSSTALATDYIVDKYIFHDGPFDSLSEFNQAVPTMSSSENTNFSYYNDAFRSRIVEWNALKNPDNKANWIKNLIASVDKVLAYNFDPTLAEPSDLDYQNMGFSELDKEDVSLLNTYIRDNELRYMDFDELIARVTDMSPLLRIKANPFPTPKMEVAATPIDGRIEAEEVLSQPVLEEPMNLALLTEEETALTEQLEEDDTSRFALPPEAELDVKEETEKLAAESHLNQLKDISFSVDESENFTKILEDEKIEVVVEETKISPKIAQVTEKKIVSDSPQKSSQSGASFSSNIYCQALFAVGSSDTSGINKDEVIADSGVTQGQFLGLEQKSIGYKVEANCFKTGILPIIELGLGLGFLKFGDLEGTYDITLTDIEQKQKIAENMWYPNTLFSLNLIPKYPLTDALDLHAKIGVSYWTNEVKIGSNSFSKTGVLPNFGVGMTYTVMKQLGVSFDIDYVKYKSTASSLISFGVVYQMDF